MFLTEKEMSEKFEKFIKNEFGNSYFKEYQGLFGRPDFVIVDKFSRDTIIISFELKLKNWKRAAIQAFRYKSFSNISYVVLSSTKINSKEFSLEYFEKYNIGLAEFNSDSNFKILFKPQYNIPYSSTLFEKFQISLKNNRRRAKNIEQLVG